MRLTLFAAVACALGAQTPDSQVVFEVASIKPAPPPNGGRMLVGLTGGPGTKDPGRFSAENSSLFNLLTYAYGVDRFQVTGPSWLDSERFNITAKVPEGATKAQLKLMLQNLLVERFKLALHRDKKDTPVYELVVAKSGPKFKASVARPEADGPPSGPPPGGPPKFALDKDGMPILPPGRSMMMIGPKGARMRRMDESLEDFAKMLQGQLGKPVADATGLKGKYDFELAWSPEGGGMMGRGMLPGPPPPGGAPGPEGGSTNADEPGPTLMSALRDQLGLKLEQKKGSVEILVIDHIEKVPTEN